MNDVYKLLMNAVSENRIDKNLAYELIKNLQAQSKASNSDIAVIGMAAKLPKIDNINEFWEQICAGTDFVCDLPIRRKKDVDALLTAEKKEGSDSIMYSPAAFLDEIDSFDYRFFNITPNDASCMDLNQRLFLQIACETLEDAGIAYDDIAGTKTGVYVGFSSFVKDMYAKYIDAMGMLDAPSIVGNLAAILPGRISYLLDLKGPSMVIDTACSSSLVAVANACRAIRSGECEMAFAGGIKINLVPTIQENVKIGMESPTFRTRTFDANADGAGIGEGVACILLKPLDKALADHDNIHAVIKGVGINQDGSSAGLTSPSPESQGDVILEAWKDAGVKADSVSYIEVHGTGTELGDPIEFKGIHNAFRCQTKRQQFCAVSSVKTNIGHLYEAAGIVGLVKCILALKKQVIPPSINFDSPNPNIDFSNSPIYFNTKSRPWKKGVTPRRCGISSFGISGTNCHVLLEEAPDMQLSKSNQVTSENNVLCLSGKNKEALQSQIINYIKFISDGRLEGYELNDISFTANTGRMHYTYRVAILFSSLQDLLEKLISALRMGQGKKMYREGIYLGEPVREHSKISEASEMIVTQYQQTKDNSYLEQLCNLYVKGANLDWKLLYDHSCVQKVSLPTYPFAHNRCWLRIPDLQKGNANDMYQAFVWKKEEINRNSRGQKLPHCLVIHNGSSRTHQIIGCMRDSGIPLQEMKLTKENGEFQLCIHKVSQILRENQVEKIIFLASIWDQDESSLVTLQQYIKSNFLSAFRLAKSLATDTVQWDGELILCGSNVFEVTGKEEVLQPQAAAEYGLGKVLSRECPWIKCRYIDLDFSTDANVLVTEISTSDTGYTTAFRSGKRYVEQFSFVNMGTVKNRKTEIRKQGVYLLAGGAGGIGLEVARHLASLQNVHLVFLNRTALPVYSQWSLIRDGIQKEHPEKVKEKINAFLELEYSGSTVDYYCTDITDIVQLEQVCTQVREKYGHINGIIQCAGLVNDAFFINKEEEDAIHVMSPKIFGTWCLDQVTRQDNLDFFVMFSSGNTIVGEPGQADYVAANSYMDAYANYRKSQGAAGRSLVIDWCSWRGTGMSTKGMDTAYYQLEPSEAVRAFLYILNKDIDRIVIGHPNYKHPIFEEFMNSPIVSFSMETLQAIRERMGTVSLSDTDREKHELEQDKEDVLLTGKEDGNYTIFEIEMGEILQKVLGYSEFDIYSNLFELGADSITLMKIIVEIRKRFQVKISYDVFLNGATLGKLAEYLANYEVCPNHHVTAEATCNISVSGEEFSLTEVQAAYLLGREQGYEMGGTSTHYYVEFETRIDIERFGSAVQKLIKRHHMLRAIILPNGMQKILPEVPDYDVTVVDARDLSKEKQEALILNCREEKSHRIFQPDKWPLFEFSVIRLDESRNYLFFDYDLLICDSASFNIMGEDLTFYYNNPDADLPPLSYTFQQYMEEYSKLKESEVYQADKSFWISKINNFPQAPQLPLIADPTMIEMPHFSSVEEKLTREEWAMLKQQAQKRGLTASSILCAGYAMVLGFWCNQGRLAINLAAFNRYPFHDEVDKLIGDFTTINLLALSVEGEDSLWNIAVQVQQKIFEALEHRSYDGVELISEISRRKGAPKSALMPIVFTSILSGDVLGYWAELGELKYSIGQTSQVYLDNRVMEHDGALSVSWDYLEGLFDRNTLKFMLNQYISLLRQLLREETMFQLTLAPEEKDRIECYNESKEEIETACLHVLFTEQARCTPEKVAVEYKDQSITYGELHRKSDQVAVRLLQEGITQSQVVGVVVERCIDTIINLLGVLKAGGAYLPLDPDYPEERRAYMIQHSKCKTVLEPSFYHDKGLEDCNDILPSIYTEAENLAYVIYTSGSTGVPKGVAITHASAANTILDINRKYSVTEGDRIIGISSMCFDLSVYDIFGALSSGATLVMIEDQREINDLVSTLQKKQITIWNSVPAIMNILVETLPQNYVNLCLRLILLSGDWIPLTLPEKIKRIFTVSKVISLGGATEASIWSIYYPIMELHKEWNSIPYGMPLANQKMYVLNNDFSYCAVGVPGEIFIGGKGVALGYYNDPEKTSQAFYRHPELGYIYRTGDYGIFHREGYIEFLGRRDQQVKISGYRIELGEIENRLAEHLEINSCAVVVHKSDRSELGLHAFYVSSRTLEAEELKAFLAKTLPGYMIPHSFMQLTQLPLTANGKINREALAAMIKEQPKEVEQRQYTQLDSDLKRKLVAICEDIMGIKGIGVTDSFFDMGLNSIVMIKLVARIGRDLNIALHLRDFITVNNIEELAALIGENDKNGQNEKEVVEYPQVSGDPSKLYQTFPLTEVQTAYLMGRSNAFELGGTSTHGYLEIETHLNANRLGIALQKLIKNHPMLRTIFIENQQQILEQVPDYQLLELDVSDLDSEEQEELLQQERERMSHHIFQPDQWPLFELQSVRLSEEKNLLLLGYDLLIVDGSSIQIFMRDLLELYETPNQTVEQLPFTFRDYVLAYKEFKKSKYYYRDKEYWMNKVSDFPSAPMLPLSMDPSEVEKPHFQRCTKVIDRENWKRLNRVARKNNITPSALLCAAYSDVLAFWSSQTKMAINVTVFNRYPFHEAVNSLIGDFTSVLLIETDSEKGKTLLERAAAIQETLMEALEHRHFEGVEFIREISKQTNMGTKAIMPIVFTSMLFNEWDETNKEEHSIGVVKRGISQTSQVYLDFQASDMNGELTLTWDYVDQILDPSMVDHMFHSYVMLLEGIMEEQEYQLTAPSDDITKISKYNETEEEIPICTLDGLFTRQAKANPQQIAVKLDGNGITYQELDQRSSQIASELQRKGVKRGEKVAVEVSRSIETIANLMGVLKAGAVYVPIEPDYPENRKKYIMKQSGCCTFLSADFECDFGLSAVESFGLVPHSADDLAYIIYTSGSTGKPKGVAISHSSAANTIQDINQRFHIGPSDRVLGISSMCFDLSVYDIFGTLSAGATLVLLPDIRDLQLIRQLIVEEKITVWNSVPAILDILLGSMEGENGQRAEWLNDGHNAGIKQQMKLQLYYWSPSVYWELANGNLMIEDWLCPEAAKNLFPQLYFLTQKGIDKEKLIKCFPQIDSRELTTFVNQLIDKKILISSIQKTEDIFNKQTLLYQNSYDERILYDKDVYEEFKDTQLSRDMLPNSLRAVELNKNAVYPEFISNRRSLREYDKTKITLDQMTKLFSVTKQTKVGQKIQYYYPSAGGLYSIDIYIYVKPDRVEGLEAGLYYYSPVENSLKLKSKGEIIHADAHYYTNKAIFNASAFSVFLVYNADANMPKYNAKGYWYALIDAGILISTLNNVAEMIGLGMCSIGDMMFERIEDLFGLNKNQVWVHTIECGLNPQRNDRKEYVELKENPVLVSNHALKIEIMSEEVEEKSLHNNPVSVQPEMLDHLRVVMLSGDWIPLNLPQRMKYWLRNASLYSLGGATEGAIWSIYYPVHSVEPYWNSIPYGYPLANQKIYVLNQQMNFCPIGVQGEIYIGGIGVAEGYYNDEAKTKLSFIEHPILGRLYKTGDYGVFRNEGWVEFLGRKDFQVKIGGHRIEMGEIEACLLEHPSIHNAIVVDQEQANRQKILCAYYTSPSKLKVSEIRDFLLPKLPHYMIPSYFIQMESIPLSANGKVQRQLLPPPEVLVDSEPVVSGSLIEQQIVEVWKSALKTENISLDSNFFDIGGDSLLLIKIHTILEKKFPGIIKVTDLFNYPTIHELVGYIQKKSNYDSGVDVQMCLLAMPDIISDAGSAVGRMPSLINMSIDTALEESIRNQMEKWNIEEDAIYFGAFVYLLAKLSGQNSLVAQAALTGKNTAQQIPMAFDKISSFEELFNEINHLLKRGEDGIDLYEITAGALFSNKSAGSIYPIMVRSDAISDNVAITGFCDLIYSLEEISGHILIRGWYAPVFEEETAVKISEMYIQILQQMLQ